MPLFSWASWNSVQVLRQHRAHALLQHAGVDALDLARVRQVAVGEAGERAVASQTRSRARKAVELLPQIVEARRHGPGDLALAAGGKRDLEVEVDVARERGGERADDRVADGAVRNLGDERGDGRQRQRFPADARMRVARGGDLGLEARIRDERDGLAVEIAPVRRLVAVAVVDQHRLGGRDAGRPQHVGRRLAGVGSAACGAAAVAVSPRAAADTSRRRRCALRRWRWRRSPVPRNRRARIERQLFSAANGGRGRRRIRSMVVAVGAAESRRRDPGGRGRSAPAPLPAAAGAGDRERSGTARWPPRGQGPPGAGGRGATDALSVGWRWRHGRGGRRCAGL